MAASRHTSDLLDIFDEDDCYQLLLECSQYVDVDELELLVRNTYCNELKVLHLNVQSLPAKFDNLMYLLEVAPDIDILMFCETHLNALNNALFAIDGYSCFNAYRSIQKGGGVSIYVRNTLPAKVIPDLSVFIEGCFESLLVEVSIGTEKLFFCEIYRPPTINFDIFYHTLTESLMSLPQRGVLGMDHNINLLSGYGDNRVLDFLSSLMGEGFSPHITKATRVTTELIS